jgi:hypothetical protein
MDATLSSRLIATSPSLPEMVNDLYRCGLRVAPVPPILRSREFEGLIGAGPDLSGDNLGPSQAQPPLLGEVQG